MKIGVAIPCYYGHINNLFCLLESINSQTIVPNKVAVSCSSTDELDVIKKYKFELDVFVTNKKLNAAQNRNNAASKLLDMDYISFIDADDIMHPQRIEILLNVFNDTNCDIILHNYLLNTSEFKHIEKINIRENQLTQCYSGCIRHCDFYKYANTNELIHHSQSSIKRYLFDIVKYPEESEFARKEDCVFCHRIFGLPNIKNVYIANELSLYNPSNTQF